MAEHLAERHTLASRLMISFVFFSRHVLLPREIAKLVPKKHLMAEAEWRSLGVQQSQGWENYMKHEPGMCHLMLNSLFIVLFIHLTQNASFSYDTSIVSK